MSEITEAELLATEVAFNQVEVEVLNSVNDPPCPGRHICDLDPVSGEFVGRPGNGHFHLVRVRRISSSAGWHLRLIDRRSSADPGSNCRGVGQFTQNTPKPNDPTGMYNQGANRHAARVRWWSDQPFQPVPEDFGETEPAAPGGPRTSRSAGASATGVSDDDDDKDKD